jgi:hypothetical protein
MTSDWVVDPGFDPIATRILVCDGKPGFEIRLGRPALAAEGDCWFCTYEVQGPLTQARVKMGGEDAMRALVLALQALAVEVEVSAENKAGRLTWLGETGDFGLPVPPWSAPGP